MMNVIVRHNVTSGNSGLPEFPDKFAIIVCGGSGTRAGGNLPKQFVEIDGTPLLTFSMRAFKRSDSSTGIILVLPEGYVDYWDDRFKRMQNEPENNDFCIEHYVVCGGSSRLESVRNGLNGVQELITNHSSSNPDEILIAVHDGARPYLTEKMINRGWQHCRKHGVAVPVVPVVDSLRNVTMNPSQSVDRADFAAVQTPQIFPLSLLISAYEGVSVDGGFTDDASVVERISPISLYEGEPQNVKVTTSHDLLVARLILKN